MEKGKLIFFDIDGTLITEGFDHYVPESTARALDMLKANGHICIINTGRPYAALDDVIMSINVSGYVCGCGTYVRLGDDILMAKHLDGGLCRDIVSEADSCGLEWVLEGEKHLYYSPMEYTSVLRNDIRALTAKLPHNISCITPDEYDGISFDKFCVAKREGSDFKRFYHRFSDRLTFIDRGSSFYEIIPVDCSKATGMRFLEEHLGISHSDTFAVGDSANDIAMLEYAQTGILMGNADSSLYEYADYITTSVTEDGILNAFRHYGLI